MEARIVRSHIVKACGSGGSSLCENDRYVSVGPGWIKLSFTTTSSALLKKSDSGYYFTRLRFEMDNGGFFEELECEGWIDSSVSDSEIIKLYFQTLLTAQHDQFGNTELGFFIDAIFNRGRRAGQEEFRLDIKSALGL